MAELVHCDEKRRARVDVAGMAHVAEPTCWAVDAQCVLRVRKWLAARLLWASVSSQCPLSVLHNEAMR
jgi:hypothetical protein